MVGEANIHFLRAGKALYIVGSPKADLRHFEAELAEEENWNVVQDGLEARVVAHPDGDGSEKYVLCRSQARSEKEKAMLERQMNRLTEELLKIDTALRKSKRKEVFFFIREKSRTTQGCPYQDASRFAQQQTGHPEGFWAGVFRCLRQCSGKVVSVEGSGRFFL